MSRVNKISKAGLKCREARERQALGKKTYGLKNVDNQIAYWCGIAEGAQFLPSSSSSVEEEYFPEGEVDLTSGLGDGETDGGINMLIPLGAAVFALLIIGGGIFATR